MLDGFSFDLFPPFENDLAAPVRSNCEAATCRGECNEDEVLIVAYCGPRRRAITLVNERTVTCPRGAATSPLVMVCAKAAP